MVEKNKETIMLPREVVNIDTSRTGKPIAPAPVIPTSPVEDPMLQGQTPVTDNDIALMQSGVSPYAGFISQPPPVASYPEISAGERALSMLSGFPIVGMFAGEPARKKMEERESMKARDAKSLDFWEKIAEKDPRRAGELLKSPVFRDPMMRMSQATSTDLENLASTLTSKDMTETEKIDMIRAGAMKNEQGEIIPIPYAQEKVALLEREDQDKFLQAALAANRDNPDYDTFDAMMDWHTKGRAGTTSKGWTFAAPQGSDEVILIDKDNGNTKPVKINRVIKSTLYPMYDNDDNFAGLLVLNPYIKPGQKPEDIGRSILTPETLFPNLSADRLRELSKDRRKFMQKVRDAVNGLVDGWGDSIVSSEVPVEATGQTDESEIPDATQIPPNAQYVGPAQNQAAPGVIPNRQPTEQESEASVGAVGF